MKIEKQSQTEEFKQPTILPHDETEEGWYKVDRKPTLVYPVTIKGLPEDDRHPQNYEKVKWV